MATATSGKMTRGELVEHVGAALAAQILDITCDAPEGSMNQSFWYWLTVYKTSDPSSPEMEKRNNALTNMMRLATSFEHWLIVYVVSCKHSHIRTVTLRKMREFVEPSERR